MFKLILAELWARVFVAYKSTLLSIALVAADVVLHQLELAPLPPWAHYLVGLAATILALYKPKAAPALPAP